MRAVVEKKEILDPSAACASDDRITVLHLIGSLNVGGAEEQLVTLAPKFDREKFRIIVGAMQPGGLFADRLAESGIEYSCLNFRVRSWPLYVIRLAAFLEKEKVDVLHAHMFSAAEYGRIAGLLAGVPVMIVTDHGQDPEKTRWQIAVDRLFNRFTAARVGVTTDVAEIIHTRDHTPRDKIFVIPNGVDIDRFHVDASVGRRVRKELGLSDDAIVVGTVARLTWEKALDVLIEAVSVLVKTNPKLRCVIVGDGYLREELEQRVETLGLQGKVMFTGTRTDVPEMLAAFDIFALSSKSEGLPVSILEAMSAGKPIVSTNVGGIPEAITDRKDALIVEPGNPQALADAISELVANPQLAADLASRASERVAEEYSITATVRKLQDLYVGLVRDARRRCCK